jgi:hypothetical protein
MLDDGREGRKEMGRRGERGTGEEMTGRSGEGGRGRKKLNVQR